MTKRYVTVYIRVLSTQQGFCYGMWHVQGWGSLEVASLLVSGMSTYTA